MRRLLPLLTLLLALGPARPARCKSQAVLTSVQEVKSLSNTQAAQAIPVKLKATVTFVRPSEKNLFVMDAGFGVYVQYTRDIGLVPGDRVAVTGYTEPSFRAIVVAREVHFLAHGALPVPLPAQFSDLIKAKWDSRYVQISGHVLSAALDTAQSVHTLRILVKVPGGTVEGIMMNPGGLNPEDLLEADVRMNGVAGGEYDSKMQLAGMWLDMSSWKDLEILKPSASDPWSRPAIPADEVVSSYRFGNDSERVKIAGMLTYFEPAALAVVEQAGGKSILVTTRSTLPLHAGIGVEATGFPAIVDESVRMEDGELRPAAQAAQIQPQSIDWEKASAGLYAYNLVAMEGEVVGLVHDSRVDLFIIRAGGHLFSATLRRSSSDASQPDSAHLTPTVGSRVRVSGVCFVEPGDHWHDRLWFDIRMRSLGDIVVLQQPSWWTVKRLAYVVTLLSVVILIAVMWAGLLDRRLRKQTGILARQSQEDAIRERRLARQEQQRSHILELISSSAPLPEVLQEIQTMVSSRLSGASCRFELSTEHERSEHPTNPAVVFHELFSRHGASLGFLIATPLRQISSEVEISAAMIAGTRLAELAIDTRRLYSDLRHRSEHDLLTDIPNRFSMQKKLDQLMQSARRNEAVFGMIYVDLDRFKEVNDRYGHRIGDLYLQEVTRRMKLQLRSGDMLARIGGDEFIALVAILRSRTDAEEITVRLERCFDEPFELEGCRMHGSASVGLAVYPEDGATEEDLQHSADAAMYVNKESKQQIEKLSAHLHTIGSPEPLR
jgi:diguanylate cyclase (GGDEF)-like protein